MKTLVVIFSLLISLSSFSQKWLQNVGDKVKTGNVFPNKDNPAAGKGNEMPERKKVKPVDVLRQQEAERKTYNKVVLPCAGNTAAELMRALPSLLSEQVILNPMDTIARDRYYAAIASVRMRMRQLDSVQQARLERVSERNAAEIERKSGDMERQAETEMMAKSKQITGLTADELKGFENASEAEQKALQDKIMKQITGIDAAHMEKMAGMSGEEAMKYMAENNIEMDLSRLSGMNEDDSQDKQLELTEEMDAIMKEQAALNRELGRIEETAGHTGKARMNEIMPTLKDYYAILQTGSNAAERDRAEAEILRRTHEYNLRNLREWHKALGDCIARLRAFGPRLDRLSEIQKEMYSGQLEKYGLNLQSDKAAEQEKNALMLVETWCGLLEKAERYPQADNRSALRTELFRFHEGDMIDYGESGLRSSLSAGDNYCFVIYNYEEDNYYIFRQGTRQGPMTMKEVKQYIPVANAVSTPSETQWTSASGQRYAVYDISGNTLILSDGSRYEYPIAITRTSNELKWLCIEQNTMVRYSIRL